MDSTNTLSDDVRTATENLRSVLDGYESLVVAFSGGVDSGLLAFMAREVLGDRMIAGIAVSPSLPQAEKSDAVAFLERYDIPFVKIGTNELEIEAYKKNAGDRCYHCKSELFARLNELAAAKGFSRVAYGSNVDDGLDYRPGSAAADEKNIVAPLVEAGLDKKTVRRLARSFGLALWDKPASPCLASRIPYFDEVTREKLAQIEMAERVLKDLGFEVCRVRHHGNIARIEIPIEKHSGLFDGKQWAKLVEDIKATGFEYVTLDLEGFRSGRLNDVLEGA